MINEKYEKKTENLACPSNVDNKLFSTVAEQGENEQIKNLKFEEQEVDSEFIF